MFIKRMNAFSALRGVAVAEIWIFAKKNRRRINMDFFYW